MKVVSTTCSNTEIISALGCSDNLIAVDDYSDFPPTVVENLPRVGPDLGIDVKAVAALKPDLVLASLTVPGHEKVVDALRAEGLAVIAPRTIGLDDVYEDIRLIAGHLSVADRAEALIRQMKDDMPKRPTDDSAPTLMVQWWPKPVIAAARDSWIHDLIELAGGKPALQNTNERSLPLEDDDPRLKNCDGWVISWCGVKLEKYRHEVLYNRPALAHCRAINRKQLYSISEEFLGRPSPRLVEGYRQLAAVIDQLKQRT